MTQQIATTPLRFSAQQLWSLSHQYGTPVWVYDANTIQERVRALSAFDGIRFAQKANSNIHILKLMKKMGVLVDAVSLGEIERALSAGFTATQDVHSPIVFTADMMDRATLAKVIEHGIPVNAGSIDMLRQLGEKQSGHGVWIRINPGFGHGHSNKTNTGGEHSKHGIWHEDLPEALQVIKDRGLRLIGLHMHIGSGVDYGHLQSVGQAMVDLASKVDIPFQAISAGGGLSIPYQAHGSRIDTAHYFQVWDQARRAIAQAKGHDIHLEIEPGRYLVAEAGVLVAEVRATKRMGQNAFVLVDAGFNDLMRPSMYGSHHDITVLAHDEAIRPVTAQVVAGPLCESGDVFTQAEGGIVQTRLMAQAQVGDLLVFHDAGAYGASMSSNYNTRPMIPEVLIENGQARLIRRRQTVSELLALEAISV